MRLLIHPLDLFLPSLARALKESRLLWFYPVAVICSNPALSFAGTNGILEGRLTNKTSGEPLPGVTVYIAATQRGGATNASGKYEIQNIRAGTYEVRFSHVGFQTYVVRNVTINPDLRTRLNVQLLQSDIQLDEVVVQEEKPLIQRDVTGTTYIVTSQDAILLPLDNVVDVVRTKPGVTLEGNIRGGKTTEVAYLIDGLPVQDALSGTFKASLPNSSVLALSVYTGGFEPEYGNALSGVVNIVTKTGTNDHRFIARAAKDNLFGGTQVSKTNEFEFSGGGPIAEQRAYYTASINGNLTDTRWWQDFRQFFRSPIDKTVNGFGKVDYLFSPTLRVGAQILYSYHDWRDYEFNWRFNLAGLPPERRTADRIATILTHTVSESFFYTASLSRFHLSSRIGSGSKEEVANSTPYQYDFFLRYIIAGQRALWSQTVQNNYTGRFDGTWKPASEHLMKFGGEITYYGVTSDLVKYEPRKTYFGKPLVDEPLLNFSSAYSYHPTAGAMYVQDKMDFRNEGLLLNVGLRYDFLDPTASRPAIEAIPVSDTAYTFNVKSTTKASLKQQFSPRLGAAIQVAENGYFFVNFGWYFQYPLFDYLYSGLDRVGIQKGVGALTGNPDLEPERTKSFELSLKYSFPHELVGSITYFKKETTNQIDTKTFIPADSKLAGTYGFAEFVNNPYGQTSGLEIVLSRERGAWLTGEFSYTYMTTEGVSGGAYDGYYIAQYGLPPSQRVFPLSWDQKHTFKIAATVSTPQELDCTVLAEYHTGRPYTNYPTSTGFGKIDGGAFFQNNARMPAYYNIDVKLLKYFGMPWREGSRLTLYLDVRNLLNKWNVKWMDSNGIEGGELHDPSAFYPGRRTTLGVQAEF